MNRFAPDYPRENGLIRFPSDEKRRRELFGDEVFHHPAKMWLYLAEEAIKLYSKEGDRILDPFGGTGTTGIGALMGRYVVLMELEEVFQKILTETKQSWVDKGLIEPSRLALLFGDSRFLLRDLPDSTFDLVLSSPPYANLQVGKVKTEFTGALAKHKADLRKYGASESDFRNFGRLSRFDFQHDMIKIYRELVRVMKPGAKYVSVTKDQMNAGERYMYSMDIIRLCEQEGLRYTGDWFKWKPPGGMLAGVMRAKGAELVEDEDIIVMEKPSVS